MKCLRIPVQQVTVMVVKVLIECSLLEGEVKCKVSIVFTITYYVTCIGCLLLFVIWGSQHVEHCMH